MKQYITVEQLEELSQPARHKLREYMLKDWARPMKDMMGNWVHADIPTDDYQLSIGQMIEFLEDGGKPLVLTKHSEWHGDGWSCSYLKHQPKELTESSMRNAVGLVSNKELCDALWEAVKEILEKDE